MRIHTDSDGVTSYINALANSISIDPPSLESWLCLHVVLPEGVPYNSIIDCLWTSHRDIDCDAFCCDGTDIFIVTRKLSPEALFMLGDSLAAETHIEIKTHGYDLFHDWHEVRELLLEKSNTRTGKPRFSFSLNKNPNGCFGDTHALTGVFQEAALSRGSRSQLYIMIVEDDPMTRRLMIEAVKEKYAVIPVATAYEAVASYLLHAPDVVFLDIGLPDVSGFKVLRQIVDNDPDAYVVMFSGDGDLDNVLGALNAGASGFITKPVSRRKLYQYIEHGAQFHHKAVEG